jgi:hypothetical protein
MSQCRRISVGVFVSLLVARTAAAFAPQTTGSRACRRTEIPPPRTTKRSAKSPAAVDEIFDDYFAQRIAEDVYQNINLPFPIPSPIVTYVLEQAVQNLSSDLSVETKIQLQEIFEAETTPSGDDDFGTEAIQGVANRMAAEINPTIDVPVLDEEQELVLLQQIMQVILQSLCNSEEDRRKEWTNSRLEDSRVLLGGPEARSKLAASIDQAIELPLPLGDAQRLALISQAVDAASDILTKFLPPDLLDTLKGESPDGLLKMKEYVIDNVNAKVDLVGFNEEQERLMIETMVNLLIDEYVDETDAEFLLMTPQEQLERLQERKRVLERERTFSQRRFEREVESIDVKLARIDKQLKELSQSKSLFSRILRR